MRIRFLGVGSAINSTLAHTSLLINDSILFDVPPNTAKRFRLLHENISKITHIFISHLHADHYFGLPLLLVEYILIPRNIPLQIYGPIGLYKNVITLLKLAFPESTAEKLIAPSKAQFYIFQEKTDIFTDHLQITPIKVKHGLEDCYGFNLKDKKSNKKVFFSGDTEYFADIEFLISSSDISILDATSQSSNLPGHMNFEQICKIAEKHTKTKFLLSHRGDYECDNKHNIIMPADGDCF